MSGLQLEVHAVEQSCGWAQHVTVYDADIELISGESSIEVLGIKVLSSPPMDPCEEDVEAACGAILEGCREVLSPRGLGIRVRITRLLLHPVDFRPDQFRIHTERALNRLLAAEGTEADSG